MAVNIASLFSRDKIIRRLEQAPLLKSTVMDTYFATRPQVESALIPAELVEQTVHEAPFIRRGAPSIPATKETGSIAFYEPLPIRVNVRVTAAELNNIKNLPVSSQEAWAARRQEMLRKLIRKTSEALTAVAMSGTFTWPVKLEGGGWDSYQVSFGSVLTVSPSYITASSKVKDVWAILTAMREALEEKGYGGSVRVEAGSTAYATLMSIAEAVTSTAKIRVEVMDDHIDMGGFMIYRQAETYRNPQTGAATKKLADKYLRMVALDGEHQMPYAAVDDLDANLQPMPLFFKPVRTADPSGYTIVGESKPFPCPNVNAIVLDQVIA
jgi:hypothetical protein